MFGRKKQKTQWMTRHQLEVLDAIRKTGRAGIKLWYTDINLSTIRSLAKRGFVDTASKGRIIVTRSGKTRLSQPWPSQQPTGDQADRTRSESEGDTEIAAPAASGAASVLTGGQEG